MTEVNTTKFYQFLAQYKKNDESWVDVADGEHGNGDGTVIKSEFRTFMNAEWNGEENGELTNDLINSFWKKIDTNTSASKISGTKLKNLNGLDKNEIANLDKTLEVYVAFDEFVSTNVKVPTALTSSGSQWKSDVTDELSKLLEAYLSSGSQGDLESILSEALPSISNKCTAQYCAVEYQDTLKSTILADYPDYKVDDDPTWQSLIQAYIGTVDADTDASTIKTDIQEILNAYFATAGLGDESPYDLESLGFDDGTLNGIQIEVITQTIKNDLAEEAKNYEGYEDQFNSAVEKFIDAKIKAGGTFEELKASASEFASSEYKTQLDNAVTIDKTYRDVVEDSDFYSRLVSEFGETLAKKIAKNDRYIEAYKDIINDVAAKVNAGEMTMDEVADYIIKQISQNLDKFFTDGLGDMSIEELNVTYDKLAAGAEAQTDDEEALKQHREAAIKYCDALVKKGEALKNIVIDVFGTSDYKGAINNMYPGDIATYMDELKAKAVQFGDVSSITDAEKIKLLQGIDDTYTLTSGETKYIILPTSATVGGKTISNDRIEYEVSGSISQKDGKLVVDSSKAGTYTGTITMIIDNIKVTTKTITLVIQKNSQQILEDATDTRLPLGNVDNWNGEENFKDLYNGDKNVILLGYADKKNKDWDNVKDTVKSNLETLGNYVVDVLVTAGLDKTKLSTAMKNIVNKYYNEGCLKYERSSGSGSKNSMINKGNTVMSENRSQTKSRIVNTKDTTGRDSNIYQIHFKDFVDDIIAEYNSLVG